MTTEIFFHIGTTASTLFIFYCPSAICKVLFLISVLYMSWLVNNPQLLCYLTHWTIFAISWLRTYTKLSWLNLAALLLITYPASSRFQMAGCYNASLVPPWRPGGGSGQPSPGALPFATPQGTTFVLNVFIHSSDKRMFSKGNKKLLRSYQWYPS